MNNENNPSDQSAPITSNAFLEQVMPQIKINEASFPLNEFDQENVESTTEIPTSEES